MHKLGDVGNIHYCHAINSIYCFHPAETDKETLKSLLTTQYGPPEYFTRFAGLGVLAFRYMIGSVGYAHQKNFGIHWWAQPTQFYRWLTWPLEHPANFAEEDFAMTDAVGC